MIKVPQTSSRFKDVDDTFMDIHDNFGIEDLKPGDVKTAAPTADDLDKGRSTIREISGVPTLYHRGTNGTIYLIATGAAI